MLEKVFYSQEEGRKEGRKEGQNGHVDLRAGTSPQVKTMHMFLMALEWDDSTS